MTATLRLIADGVKAPPYPADTSVVGSRFPVDMPRLTASNTWTLAAPTPELRPWLLMLWAISWTQVPAGAYDDDDALIAAKIGMPLTMFQTHRATLLRGWWKASDGRLYHNIVSELVLDKLAEREAWRKRHGALGNTSHRGGTTVHHGGTARAGAGAGAGKGLGTALENTLRVGERSLTLTPDEPRPEKPKLKDLRGTRLEPDAPLPDEWKAWAIECYPKLKPPEVVRMWVEFRNYWSDKPGKDGLHVRWFQTWQNNVHRRMK